MLSERLFGLVEDITVSLHDFHRILTKTAKANAVLLHGQSEDDWYATRMISASYLRKVHYHSQTP